MLHHYNRVPIYDSITYTKNIINNEINGHHARIFLTPYRINYLIFNSRVLLALEAIGTFLLSLYFLMRIGAQLRVIRPILTVIIIALLPNNLIYNSTIMSEGTLMLAIFLYLMCINELISKPNIRNLLLTMAAQWLCIIPHSGIGALVSIHFIIMLTIHSHSNASSRKLILVLIFLALNASYLIRNDFIYFYLTSPAYVHLRDTASGQGTLTDLLYSLSTISHQYTAGVNARSAYSLLDADKATLLELPVKIVSYIAGPFFFEINNPIDFIYIATSTVRLLCILYVSYHLKYILANMKLFSVTLITIMLILLYALATGNYGTAFRHNIISDTLLILISSAVLSAQRTCK